MPLLRERKQWISSGGVPAPGDSSRWHEADRVITSASSAKKKDRTHALVIQVTAVLPVRDEINVLP